ncbi:LysR family transcriptional regulator [Oxalobacteraceae bacterium R-40]|uniref:LysR family transcriptional regulator n=1 Tax=Keguizhuia sedimenti TaxID=3064264 RepID=A0ABU1BSE1_9BURK|nr:LysR family transcriptional regulator [Oxalobacteraceae bacterium R-40]
MQIDPNDLILFTRVMDAGGFSRAAERLGWPKSTVSRRIALLEAKLGERLLLRTTRKLTITEFGQSVLEHARQIAAETEAAASLALHRQAEPSGRLRISMPGDFANWRLGEFLAEFAAAHPAIILEIDISPRRVDLIGENFDLALRVGTLPDDASLVARRLTVFSAKLYAAPAYLKQRGIPQHPDDLLHHDTLRLLARSGEPADWPLSMPGERWSGTPPIRAAVNSPELLMRLACSGAGITALDDLYAERPVQSGELVPVLPQWSLPEVPLWMVFPGRRLMPARTRVFIDSLQGKFDSGM